MKIILTTLLLLSSFAANAGFKLLTEEEVVSAVLNSQELASEKSSNSYLNSLSLKSVDLQNDQGSMKVFLTYSNGDAPCTVVADVVPKNTVPEGAQGVNMVAEITAIKSACAVN